MPKSPYRRRCQQNNGMTLILRQQDVVEVVCISRLRLPELAADDHQSFLRWESRVPESVLVRPRNERTTQNTS
jgi:hypothetical protein